MDQHEKDWLDLGRQLKYFSPKGNPAEDFQGLQELQKQQADQRKGGPAYWISENLLLLVLLPLLGLIAFSVGKGQLERYERKAAVQQAVVAEGKTTDLQLPTEADVEEQPTVPVVAEVEPSQVATFDPPTKSEQSVQMAVQVDSELTPVKVSTPKKDVAILAKEEILNLPGSSGATAPISVVPPSEIPIRTKLAVQALPMMKTLRVPDLEIIPSANVFSKSPANLQITLGTGLSNHWRGANFMQEVDRGIYAYIGLNRRLGQRLGLEGRLGYRSHGMRLPVFSDVDAPWSYHKEEIHNTGQMGEDRAYIYEGVVEGYQAVEFSLLANYQLSTRLSLSGGVRYSLPDLAFERTVVGPDEENPFFEFIEGQPLVKYQDYGALLGAEYHFSRFLALEAGLHLGMVDLIDDAAAGRVRFNHSSSVSIGVKYKLGE
jgi:hypothetical protein